MRLSENEAEDVTIAAEEVVQTMEDLIMDMYGRKSIDDVTLAVRKTERALMEMRRAIGRRCFE